MHIVIKETPPREEKYLYPRETGFRRKSFYQQQKLLAP
jgi:hypothetical protein